MNFRSLGGTLALIAALGARVPARAQETSWPDLSSPARAVGGGSNDAAVVVGVEDYLRVPGVPGAKSNAKQWYEYLTETRGVPAQNVKFLTNDDATREEILEASRKAAGRAGPEGTLWFVFVGHGAPSPDGKDGLLVGVDAQQKAESLEARSVRRQELLKTLGKSRAGAILVVLDACFSGRGQDGGTIVAGLQPLVTVAAPGAADPRMTVLTAAKGNQFAGALPGASRPAFSYLVLGGLRGWAADGKKATVTAGDLWRYATNALEATLRGRDQTPDLMGKEDAVVGVSAGEKGPSLSKLAAATSGGSAVEFKVSALPGVPKAVMPSLSAAGGPPRMQVPGAIGGDAGIDFGAVDVDALGQYDDVVKFEKSGATPESKAARWRALGDSVKTYADVAAKRAKEWDEYAEQAAFNAVLENDKGAASPEAKATAWKKLAFYYPKFKATARQRMEEWERYAKELAAVAAAREKRDDLMDKDWSKLSKLLSYSVVSAADKQKFAATFVQTYGKTSQDNPYVAELAPFLPAGTVTVIPGAARPARARAAAANTAAATGRAPEIFKVRFATTKGDMIIEVNRSWSPNGADRFYNLVESGFYDDAAVFRVITGFMAQLGIHGDPAVAAKWRGASIQDDPPAGQSNKPGYVTFAKTGHPNSRTTQIFFNIGNNSFLDGQGFTPFGRIIEGASVPAALYAQYGEGVDQGAIQSQGKTYLRAKFPNLDYIKTARLVP